MLQTYWAGKAITFPTFGIFPKLYIGRYHIAIVYSLFGIKCSFYVGNGICYLMMVRKKYITWVDLYQWEGYKLEEKVGKQAN